MYHKTKPDQFNEMVDDKKLDWNYTRMLRVVLNKSRKQYPTKQQLYGHFFLISQTTQERQAGQGRHCWRSKVALISDMDSYT